MMFYKSSQFLLISILFLFYSCNTNPSLNIIPNTLILEENEPKTKTRIQLAVKNDGNIPINNIILKPACSCYEIASITDSLIPQARRSISFDFFYPPSSGPFSETIRVEMESGKHSQKTVQLIVITGVTRPTISVLPSALNIEVLPNIQSFTSFFEINLLDKKALSHK